MGSSQVGQILRLFLRRILSRFYSSAPSRFHLLQDSKPESKPEALPDLKRKQVPYRNYIYPRMDNLLKHLLAVEGRGDDVTDVVTGLAGMTKGTYNRIQKSSPKSLSKWDKETPTDKELLTASRMYANKIYSDFTDPESDLYLEGFIDLPSAAQDGIISSAYNLGEGAMPRFKGFRTAVKNKDPYEAMRQLLDTANTEGKSSKGLAIRRAKEFNAVASQLGRPRIDRVVAAEDGTISYLGQSGDGEVLEIMKYKKPRHKTSKPGIVEI